MRSSNPSKLMKVTKQRDSLQCLSKALETKKIITITRPIYECPRNQEPSNMNLKQNGQIRLVMSLEWSN